MIPLISIVTLTYKKFDSIYETIQSVLDQDQPQIEYIISDDGSAGFPREEIEEYIRRNKKENVVSVKILTVEKNTGTVRNINRAYKAAAGKYILNLSADEVFTETDTVGKILREMEEHGCEVLVTRRIVCSEAGDFLGYLPKVKNIGRIKKLDTPLLQHKAFLTDEFYDMASGSVLCVRKDTIEAMGWFDENYVLWEDGPFFSKYTKKALIHTDYDIVSIRYKLGGVSNSGTNPLMDVDYKRYNAVERCEDLSDLDTITRMKIDYICQRDLAETRNERIKLYLKNPAVMFLKVLYKIRNS